MDDPVRAAAQQTVDEIDRRMSELGAAREALVNLFGLGVKIPTPPNLPKPTLCPDPEGWRVLSHTADVPQNAPKPPPEPPAAPQVPLPPAAPPGGCTPPLNADFRGYETGEARTDRHQAKREEALGVLARDGRSRAWQVRALLGVHNGSSRVLFDHPWFVKDGHSVALSLAGRAEAEARGLLAPERAEAVP